MQSNTITIKFVGKNTRYQVKKYCLDNAVADTCGADTCNADTCNADTCNADTCKADTCKADTCAADSCAPETDKKEPIEKKEADANHATQLQQLNTYFLEGINTCDLERSLLYKISGYKAQDLKNKKIVLTDGLSGNLITLAEVTEKLVASRLRCCYCSKEIKLFYLQNRDALQWTLDRLDNDLAHTNVNTVIACLGCNLQRRNRAADKFMFTKKLKITKM